MKTDVNHNLLHKRVSFLTYPFFILFFLCFVGRSFSQWIPDSTATTAYQLALSLMLDDAEKATHNTDLPAHLYIHHLSKAIRAVINENDEIVNEFEQYHSYSYDRIQVIASGKDNPYQRFYRAEMQLQSAFVHIKNNETWSGVLDLRRAYIIIKANKEAFPDFLPNNKTLGLIHIIIGSIPDKYQWVFSILGINGEVQQGLAELDKLANSNNMFRQEAKILIALVNAYILQHPSIAVDELHSLYQNNTNNILFGYIYASLLMKNSNSDKALAVLDHLLSIKNKKTISFPILEYLKAEILLQKGNYSSSISWYQHFIKWQQGNSFIKDAYYKIAISHLLQGANEKATEYIDLAIANGSTNTEVDKYAQTQLVNRTLPNPTIVRLRYATDGGYYERANALISQVGDFHFAEKIDEVEFNYRKARLYHKTGKTGMAIALYKVTINATKNEEWYFGPNSALQLGYIYEAEKEIEMAKKYFKMAMNFNNHEYKNSIDNKAKSALAGLE
ncbi:MAG: hypothetical protein OEX22_12995 [Cyclobacteriaceae bacterium]|nr:hypothetical protein [Cyclobacteriaceae bacterium]